MKLTWAKPSLCNLKIGLNGWDFCKWQSAYAAAGNLKAFVRLPRDGAKFRRAAASACKALVGAAHQHLQDAQPWGILSSSPRCFSTYTQGVAGEPLLQFSHGACRPSCSSAFFWHAEIQGNCATCGCLHSTLGAFATLRSTCCSCTVKNTSLVPSLPTWGKGTF